MKSRDPLERLADLVIERRRIEAQLLELRTILEGSTALPPVELDKGGERKSIWTKARREQAAERMRKVNRMLKRRRRANVG